MARNADKFDFTVKWLPFLLQPGLPKEGVDRMTYYRQKFGPRAAGAMERLKTVGKDVGINFCDDAIIGNTLDSHRLVEYADRKGKQDAVIEGVFKAYFEQGKNLGSIDVLTSIAKDAGLDEAETRTYLQGEEDKDWVLTMDQHWKEQMVDGVPFFVFNDKISFSGGQEPEVFEQVWNALQRQQGESSS
jgi:predicted DsbA family dithiol-disulfide isomerase